MTEKKKTVLRAAFRLVLAILACAGLRDTIFGATGGFMGVGSLNYYTIQSNIWALLLAVTGVTLSVWDLAEPRWFRMLRYVIAVGIMVTFLVFWTMLAPTMKPSYLVSVSNLTLHTLVPLMTLADALFLDGYLPTKKQVLLCMAPTLWYLGFAMLRAELGAPLHGGSRYPYWFLDVDKFGWFRLRDGVGVFYWVLVMVVIVLGLGYLLRAVARRRAGSRLDSGTEGTV